MDAAQAETTAEPDVASPQARAQPQANVYYSGCREVRAAGRAPLYRGQPGYRIDMDGDEDEDGIACEPHISNVIE